MCLESLLLNNKIYRFLGVMSKSAGDQSATDDCTILLFRKFHSQKHRNDFLLEDTATGDTLFAKMPH